MEKIRNFKLRTEVKNGKVESIKIYKLIANQCKRESELQSGNWREGYGSWLSEF